jgi:hypothetical protein
MREWVLSTDDHDNENQFKDAEELSNSGATRGWWIIITLDVKHRKSLVKNVGILVKDLPVPSGVAERKR